MSKFVNLDVPLNFPKFREPIEIPAQCPECFQDISSSQRMLAHRSRKHDYINPIHAYVNNAFCPICMYFHNRTRVLNHIKYRSQVCKGNLIMQGPIISIDEARALDEEHREEKRELYSQGYRAHAACQPVFRLVGPLPYSILTDDNMSSKHHTLGKGRNHHC